MKIIFLGIQGSGKSTQAKKIGEFLKVPYIEMSNLLRDKSKNSDDVAKQIRDALNTGNLVPNEITIGVLKERLSRPDCQNGFVLDGYPRTKQQLENLPKDIDKVFNVSVPDEEAITRLLARSRQDDTRELIEKRIAWHHQQTEPLLAYFKNKGILKEIDGQEPIEDVHLKIIKLIKNESS